MDTTATRRSTTTAATQLPTASVNASSATGAAIKVIYSAPASPAAPTTPTGDVSLPPSAAANSSPASGATSSSSSGPATTVPHKPYTLPHPHSHSVLSTPKKNFLDAVMLQTIREKLKTPRSGGGSCDLHTLRLGDSGSSGASFIVSGCESVNVIKDRYLISSQPCQISAAAAAKTPASYRHLIDLTSSNLRCTDVFTEEQFLCKIVNEPLHKVQRAYFQLQQEAEHCRSSIYGHALIRAVHDIVPFSKHRTYVIIAMPQVQTPNVLKPVNGEEDDEEEEEVEGIYEDLHTYIRNKRRLGEAEARALFHQICQTVQVCHRNGIILRDLKLKRFYFIDEARTKLQYESLEGSMILDDPADDMLSDKIGCPLYTAPELLCPTPTYRGKPADMWSLGVILYTMLVGQYPFFEKGNCNLIMIIRHCHVQIPSTLSRSVRWLLLALLRKSYEERIQADHIFHTPWLKEQRPYYMYIPVDVVIPDDDEIESEESQLPEEECETTAKTCAEQPLDYTRSALQMECEEGEEVEGVSTAETGDNDVDMG